MRVTVSFPYYQIVIDDVHGATVEDYGSDFVWVVDGGKVTNSKLSYGGGLLFFTVVRHIALDTYTAQSHPNTCATHCPGKRMKS